MKHRDSWHRQALLCAFLNTLLVAITVAMVIVARIYIGKCHDVCAFAGSDLHKLTGNVKSVLYAGDVEGYSDEFILVDSSTNLVCMLTKSVVSLDSLLELESIQSSKYKQRLFCFAHESLSIEALSVVLSKLRVVLRRTEIYLAGVEDVSCRSLYAAMLADCPLRGKCIDQRMLCVRLRDWEGGTGEIMRLRYVWPKRYPIEFLENTSDEVESAVYETTDESRELIGQGLLRSGHRLPL